jgi:flagellar protein FlgJ
MDINSLGTQYMNSSYVPFFFFFAPSAPALQPRGDNAFADMLKRVQDAQDTATGDSVSPLSGKSPIDKNDQLYELCVELETFLIKNLLKSMRSTVQKTNLIDTGFAGEMYEDMLYDEYAKSYAKNAGFGFAEMAYRDLKGQS